LRGTPLGAGSGFVRAIGDVVFARTPIDAVFGDFGAFGGDYLFCRFLGVFASWRLTKNYLFCCFLCVLCGLARSNLFCCFPQGQRCESEASRALDQVAIFDREDIPSFFLF
jgi:hypothetical protein